jgi:antitoxin PrlF
MEMGVSRVTDKFQVTIPKDVRESVGLRPGEEVTVEGAPGGAIIVKRFETVKDPLTVLIGKRSRFRKPISVEKLERLSEDR